MSILKTIQSILTKKEKQKLLVFILFDILINILDILSLIILLWLVQFYISGGSKEDESFTGWLTDNNSVALITLFFVLFSFKNIGGYLVSKNQFKYASSVATRLSRNNLQKYQDGSFEEFVKIDSSAQIHKIAFQPFEFCQYYLSGFQQIITQGTLVVITIIAVTIFNAKLFLLLLAILLPPVILVFFLVRKNLSSTRTQIRSGNEKSFRYLLDALKGYPESNIYGSNHFFMKRFINERALFSKHLFHWLAIQNLPNRIIEIFAVLGLFLLIIIAKWSGNDDSATLLTIGAFIAAAYKIIPGLVRIINIGGQMKAFEFSVAELSESEKIPESLVKNASLDSVELKDVSFHYGNQQIIKDLDLSICKGDFLGITGRSGMGKTTLLNLIAGFLSPANGEIYFNGESAGREEMKLYWPVIAYVRQQSFFIHDTILRNITLSEHNPDLNRLGPILDITGITEMMEAGHDDMDKIITENGKNISGGQQQRISIARAFYKDADLLLLDEPFNELDEASENRMLEYCSNLVKQGKMIVLITHNKKAVGYCNKMISLDE